MGCRWVVPPIPVSFDRSTAPAVAARGRGRSTVHDPADPPAGPGIRVVTVPYSDPYVDAVLPEGAVRVGPAQGPSPWLDPAYLVAHADGVDVVHLHAGYGHLPEDEVVSWAETVRRTGVPLVLTVHELRDPERSEEHTSELQSRQYLVCRLLLEKK